VLLAGWRRNYLINKLNEANIPYTYRELTDQQTLNELYSLADFYIIASRCEGGPQALLESPACGTPVVSTDVGMAQEILPSSCIINAETDEYIPNEKDLHKTIQKIIPLEIRSQIKNYDLLFSNL
jgi:glycosyltransferase involved in cell wall biosynthesis